jgi:hypothetical protein
MRQAIDSVKNARSWLDKIEFMLHLSDDAEMTENFMLNMQSVMAEDYPWPARTFDGTWALGGPRYIDGTWILDGTVGLNGVDGTAYALDSDIENLVLSGICFRGLVDDFARTGQELNGLWNLDGENTLGNDALPLDANGMITVKRVRYLDGSWRLNGGDINYINGSMYLDGRFDLAGGGNRLNCETWTDILDGGKVIKRPEKIIPYDLLHPALEDNMDNIGEDVSLIKRLCGINLDDSTMRPIELDEGLPLDGALQLGDNITPFEAETNLEVRKAHRLNGQWVLDGGDLLMLDGVFYLDGTEMLSERGNRLEISRECIHF